MHPKTKNILAWSGLIALSCSVLWCMYKYINRSKVAHLRDSDKAFTHLLDSYEAIFSSQNIAWLKRYLAPGHLLDVHKRGNFGGEFYPFMLLVSNNWGVVPPPVMWNEMTGSEILLRKCFNNFPQDSSLDPAPSPLSRQESGNRPKFPIPPPGYTLNEHAGRICDGLSYLELFDTLARRYSMYFELTLNGEGGFNIQNKVTPACGAIPEKDRGSIWLLQEARYREVDHAIELMDFCKNFISSAPRRKNYEDIARECKEINLLIENLNKFTLAEHNAYLEDLRPIGYCQPTPLPLMSVDQELLWKVQNNKLDRVQPIINLGGGLYEAGPAARDFTKGERVSPEGDLSASKSTQSNSNNDISSGQIKGGSHSL